MKTYIHIRYSMRSDESFRLRDVDDAGEKRPLELGSWTADP